MARPDLSTITEFYRNYISLVDNDDLKAALADNTAAAQKTLQAIPSEKWDFRYAEDKWTIKEMVQHLIDAERIFAYRSLCIARGETQSLPGFDENLYARNSAADRRQPSELLNEFFAVRKSTEALFSSFDETQLAKTGVANNKPISVNTIGYITVGHLQHHLNILHDRYL